MQSQRVFFAIATKTSGHEEELNLCDLVTLWRRKRRRFAQETPEIALVAPRNCLHQKREGISQAFVAGTTALVVAEADDRYPSWSPDGSSIVFSSDRDDNTELYVMNADGTNQTRLTQHEGDDLAPVWSPDGSMITFVCRLPDGNMEVFVVDVDGANLINLSNNEASDSNPRWLPRME